MPNPKFTLSLDASQLSAYLTCPMYWNLKYRQSLRLAEERTLAMDRGTCMHALLETFYKLQIRNPSNRAGNSAAAKELVNRSGIFDELKIPEDDVDLINLRFGEYVLYYTFTDFKPAHFGGQDGVELGFSKIIHETDDVCFILDGKIDLVVENPIGEIFWDHKCTASEYYVRKLQLLAYAWATGFRYGGYNYVGLQKAVGKRTFRRNPTHFPEHLIERWKKNAIKTFYKVKQDMLCDSFDENIQSCSGGWDTSPCDFCTLCESENDQTKEALKSFKYFKSKRWRPWEIGV